LKKIILTSFGLPVSCLSQVENLIGEPFSHKKFAFIGNAKDLRPPEKQTHSTQTELENVGFNLENLDLRDYFNSQHRLESTLKQYDGVWVGGGDIYYLRYAMEASGFDTFIINLIENGFMYGGTSAGAIVAGLTLDYFEGLEPPNTPKIIYTGLGLIDFTVIPHCENTDYNEYVSNIKLQLEANDEKVVCLKDTQIVITNGTSVSIHPDES
jgi:dipeptidase E